MENFTFHKKFDYKNNIMGIQLLVEQKEKEKKDYFINLCHFKEKEFQFRNDLTNSGYQFFTQKNNKQYLVVETKVSD